MKKILVAVLAFIILPINIFAISASKAVVMDLNSGRVLYDLNNVLSPTMAIDINKSNIIICYNIKSIFTAPYPLEKPQIPHHRSS